MTMRSLNTRKPTRHHNIDVWQRNNETLHFGTYEGKEHASGIRFRSQQLRSEALGKIHWNREDSNAKLTDRIIDIERLYLQLDQVLRQVEEQIISVTEAKKAVENAHTNKFPFNMACKRSLDVREARRDLELVNDFVNNALNQESRCLEIANQQLREKGMQLWDRLCSLKEIGDKLRKDLKAKGMAAKEDKHLRAINLHSSDITLKHLPTDPPSGLVSETQWADTSLSNKQQAEKEVQRSQDLVCEAFSVIRHVENEVLQHKDNTEECMRRRVYQVQSARDLLQNQKELLLQELQMMSNEIVELEKTMESTKAPLKLVHTRLETRKWYPSMETCSDGPRKSLTEELMQIEKYKRSLVEKLEAARSSMNNLQMQLGQVERDLEKKDQTLQVETKSLEIHAHPLIGEHAFQWIEPSILTDSDSFASSEMSAMIEQTNPTNLEESVRQRDGFRLNRPKPRDSLTIGLSRSSEPVVPSQVHPEDVTRGQPAIQLPDVIPRQSYTTLASNPSDFSSFSDSLMRDSEILMSG